MRRTVQFLGVGVLFLLGVAVVPTGAHAANARPPSHLSTTTTPFSITTTPALIPAFDPAVTDYAVRCVGTTAHPLAAPTFLTTTGSGTVTVATKSLSSPVSVDLPLIANQSVTVNHNRISYFIRCLPADFPSYTSSVTGSVQATGFSLDLEPYAVVFDTEGVPVWWYRVTDPSSSTGAACPSLSPFDVKFLTSTTMTWWEGCNDTYQLRGLNGTLKKTLPISLNFHDLQIMPNGDYLAIQDETGHCCVDLSSWSQASYSDLTDPIVRYPATPPPDPSSASITDQRIVEFNSNGKIVWSWDVAQHVDVATADQNWHDDYPDVIHMNSIEYDGNGGIIWSARHLDAAYRIDMTTGNITWQLGGTTTPQSLSVSGDPNVSTTDAANLFSGQHFARLAPDGSVTVHDNETLSGRPPRAVDFNINAQDMTATEVQQITDPRVTGASCCGSAQLLAGGNWVITWGASDITTELTPSGTPVLTITYPGSFSYRAQPVLAPVTAMRTGMNSMQAPLTTVTVDNTPPVTSVILPASGATLTGTGAFLDATASDNVSVASVVFTLTGGTYSNSVIGSATPTLYGYLNLWNTTTVPDGSYTLQSLATDSAGNTTYSTGIPITVDNTPPVTSVIFPASGATLTGTGAFLDATASDNVSVASVVFTLTGGTYSNSVIGSATPSLYGYYNLWDTTTVPNGSYTLQSLATDSAGNTTSSTGVPITVSN